MMSSSHQRYSFDPPLRKGGREGEKEGARERGREERMEGREIGREGGKEGGRKSGKGGFGDRESSREGGVQDLAHGVDVGALFDEQRRRRLEALGACLHQRRVAILSRTATNKSEPAPHSSDQNAHERERMGSNATPHPDARRPQPD